MINLPLFSFASNDASLMYLQAMFGSMDGIINSKGFAVSGVSITILGTMFSLFNSIILAVAVLIVVYVTVVGVMMTAHEGEFMKHWNSAWMPLRVVLGVASLVPTGSGFSALQMLMMWVIVQGIGAADSVWSTALNYAQTMSSPQSQATFVSSVGVDGFFQDLFSGLACDASARRAYDNPFSSTATSGGYYCNSGNTQRDMAFCNSSGINGAAAGTGNSAFDKSSGVYQMGPAGACGKLAFCNTASCQDMSTLKCQVCAGQAEALEQVVATFSTIASTLVDGDYNYQSFYYSSANSETPTNLPNSLGWLSAYCSNAGISTCSNTSQSKPLPSPGAPGASSADASTVNSLYWPYLIKPVVSNVNFIDTSMDYYLNALGAAMNAFIISSSNTQLQGTYGYAQNTGWLFAGGWYYLVAKVTNANVADSVPELNMAIGTPGSVLASYKTNFATASLLINDSKDTGTTGDGSGSGSGGGGGSGTSDNGDGGDAKMSTANKIANLSSGSKDVGMTFRMDDMSKIFGAGSDALNNGFTAFTKAVGLGSNMIDMANPIMSAQKVGIYLIQVVETAVPIMLFFAAVLGIIGFLGVEVFGTGAQNPVGGTVSLLLMLLIPIIYLAFGIFLFYGGMLAVYTPLIPYIFFTFGAIGWFISIFEAMAAGPLIALGILSPGGHSMLLGKAEPALTMLFSIFLRPSLMIFGLVAGNLLAAVLFNMINQLFWTLIIGYMVPDFKLLDIPLGGGNSIPLSQLTKTETFKDPVTMIFILGAYVFLVVTCVSKSFSLIHILPDRVLGWVSGQGAHSEKGSEEVAGLKSQAEGAAQKMDKGVGDLKATRDKHHEEVKAAGKGKGGGGGPGGGMSGG